MIYSAFLLDPILRVADQIPDQICFSRIRQRDKQKKFDRPPLIRNAVVVTKYRV